MDGDSSSRPYHNNPNSAFITILDKDNKVVANPGGIKSKYVKDELQLMPQDQPMIKYGHDVCIDEDQISMSASGTPIKNTR